MNILSFLEGVAGLVNTIFKGKNDAASKSYAKRSAEIKILIGNEKAKPMDQWIHTDIESWSRELNAILPLANAEVEAYGKK